MAKWEPSVEVLAMLPCPWAELSEAERAFVEAVCAPGGLGGVLAAAAESMEGAVPPGEGSEGATPSGLAPRRLPRP